MDPGKTASIRSSLILVCTVCIIGFLILSLDDKQITLVAIGALRVNRFSSCTPY